MTLITRILFGLYALLFTRHRTNLHDIADFRTETGTASGGIAVTVSGTLVESSRKVVAVSAQATNDEIRISIVSRGIAWAGTPNAGQFRETIPISLARHGTYRLIFNNRDGTGTDVGQAVL